MLSLSPSKVLLHRDARYENKKLLTGIVDSTRRVGAMCYASIPLKVSPEKFFMY